MPFRRTVGSDSTAGASPPLPLAQIADEPVLVVETEDAFAAALDTGYPILAPPEVAERFGLLADLEEDVGDPKGFLPPDAAEADAAA